MSEPRIIRVAGAIAEARPLADAALYERKQERQAQRVEPD